MDVASSSQASHRQGSRVVATAVEHPRLTKTNSAAICMFLREYDQYDREVKERAQQIVCEQVLSTDVAKPVQHKFCVDSEWLESVIELDYIKGVKSYDELTDANLCEYLESKAEPSKSVVTTDMLDKIFEDSLRMDMTDNDARSRIEDLFVTYKSLLRRHGVSWVAKENEKVAVYHVLSAIRPVSLRCRLESDLELSHYSLRKDFKGFMAHAIKLSEAFQLVDIGPPTKSGKPSGKTRGGEGRGKNNDDDDKGGKEKCKESGKDGGASANKQKLPIFLYPPHKAKGLRHYLRDCKSCPESEKKALLDKYNEEKEKAATGRKKTLSQTSGTESGSTKSVGRVATVEATADSDVSETKSVARVNKPHTQNGSSFEMSFMDGEESKSAQGRADDAADESLVSSHLAEGVVLNGIGRMKKIKPVTLKVDLKDGEEAEKFTFSRVWTVPYIFLKLSAGPLALLNVEFLVADNKPAA